ncbi:hypothetical protein HY988_04035 [Candidatus Micrarchaeota archaeon]|nr:hypothetical protein [Candidatus Micrarchaeota archaeon]
MKFALFSILLLLVLFGCLGQDLSAAQNLTNQSNQSVNSSFNSLCSGASEFDPYAKGQTNFNGTIYIDSCDSNNTVRKYFCKGPELVNISSACYSGYFCNDGACIKLNEHKPLAEGCIETGAPKDPYSIHGVIYQGSDYSDLCQGASDLLRYHCQNGKLTDSLYHCTPGDRCQDGRCAHGSRYCEESGSAATLYDGGAAIVKNQNYCLNSSTQLKYGCANGSIVNASVQCDQNSYCYGDSCIQTCQPLGHSNGPGVFFKGTPFVNYCQDNSTLVNYTCLNGNIKLNKKDCSGYCLGNLCLDQSQLSCAWTPDGGAYLSYTENVVSQFNNSCLDYHTAKIYRCDGSSAVLTYSVCPLYNVCSDGQCIPITHSSCYPSDSRSTLDPHQASSIFLTDGSSVTSTRKDSCYTDTAVTKYSCDGSYPKVNYVYCGSDERCINGACAYAYGCQETQRTSTSPGKASLYDRGNLVRQEQDICLSNSTLRQVSCDSTNHVAYSNLPCQNGLSCDGNRGICK